MGKTETDPWAKVMQKIDEGDIEGALNTAIDYELDHNRGASDATQEHKVPDTEHETLKCIRSIAVDNDRTDVVQKITDLLAA